MTLLNAVFNIGASRLVSAFIAFLVSFVLMSELSVTDFGNFYFYLSIITLATTLPCIGINNSYIFNNDEALEGKFISLKLLLVFSFSTGAFLLYLVGLLSDVMILISLVTGFIFSFFDSHLSNLQCKKKFKQYALHLPLKNILVFTLVFILVDKIDEPVYVFTFVAVATLVVLFYYYFGKLTINMDFNLFKSMAGGFYFFEVSSLIMVRSETWWLKFYSEAGEVNEQSLGVFGAAFTVCTIVSIVATAVNSAMLPFIKNKPELLRLRNLALLSFVAVCFLLAYYFVSWLVIDIYFEDKFSASLSYIPYILIGMFFSFIAGVVRLDLVRRDLLAYLNKVYLLQLVITIIAGAVFIYLYGLMGAIAVFVGVRFLGLIFICAKYDFKIH